MRLTSLPVRFRPLSQISTSPVSNRGSGVLSKDPYTRESQQVTTDNFLELFSVAVHKLVRRVVPCFFCWRRAIGHDPMEVCQCHAKRKGEREGDNLARVVQEINRRWKENRTTTGSSHRFWNAPETQVCSKSESLAGARAVIRCMVSCVERCVFVYASVCVSVELHPDLTPLHSCTLASPVPRLVMRT